MIRLGIISGIVVLLLILPALVLRSEPATLAIAHWAIETFTDLHLELRNPQIRLYEGRVVADEIHLTPKGSDGPARISIMDFHADTTLTDLFSENLGDTRIQAGEVLIYVSENDELDNPAPMEWLQKVVWLPRELRINKTRVVTSSDRTRILVLENLRGDRSAGHGFQVTAVADYRADPVLVTVALVAERHEKYLSGLDIEGRILDPAANSRVDFNGQLHGSREDFTYDLNLEAHYPDVASFFKGFKGGGALQGSLELSAKMQGDGRSFELADATLILDNKPSYAFEASGSLTFNRSGDSSMNLNAAGEMDSLRYLLHWIDLDVGDFAPTQANITLSGSLDFPVIEKFVVSTSNAAGLSINVTGRLEPEGLREAPGPTNNEVFMEARGPALGVLERWIGTVPYELGPWRASAHIRKHEDRISLDDLVFEQGSHDTFELRAAGRVGNIAGYTGEELAGIEDVTLTVSAYTPDSAHLASLFDLDIPAHHEIRASLELAGSGQRLASNAGDIRIKSSDLNLEASPVRAVIYPGRENALQNLSTTFSLELSDSSALAQYTSGEIPALGRVKASGTLVGEQSLFQVRDLTASLAGDWTNLQARGKIGNLNEFSDVLLSGNFEDLDTHRALRFLFDELAYDKPLDTLRGAFSLTGNNGDWDLNQFTLESSREDGPVELKAAGSLENITGFPTANLNARFHMRDPALLQAITGLRVNPGEGSFVARSKPSDIELTANLRLGETYMEGEALIARNHSVIKNLRLSMMTPQLNLVDLGLQAQETAGENYKPATQLEQPGDQKNSFIDLLDKVPDYPIDVAVKIDNIVGDSTNIHHLDIHLTSENNRYTVRRFNANYNEALGHLRAVADFNLSPPAISLAARAYSIPLGLLVQDLGMETNVTGELAIRGGLTAYGDNAQALRSSMDGNLAVEVPHSLRLRGDFDNPHPTISPLRAVADAYADVITLIPQLTMKLFGVKFGEKNENKPCRS